MAQGVSTSPAVAAFLQVLQLCLLQYFFARENMSCSGDDPNSMYAVRLVMRLVMQLLQGSREGQDAMVKLLQHGVPDAVVGNACVVIMQLANDAKDVPCLQAFGRLGAIAALLDVIKRVRGAAQKNAAIAVARLAQEPSNGLIMQALHGVEIIGSYLHK